MTQKRDSAQGWDLTVGDFAEMQAACAVAEPGDTIWMLPGTYVALGSLFVQDGVTVRAMRLNGWSDWEYLDFHSGPEII